MKNAAMATQGRTGAVSEPWREALRTFDSDLRRRGAAERTRRAYGTDEDSSIGSAASHGCIRMHIPDVEELYPQVPVGAPVYIA